MKSSHSLNRMSEIGIVFTLVAILIVTGCGGGKSNSTPINGGSAAVTDITNYATTDITQHLSIIGEWDPFPGIDASLINFWGAAKLGVNQSEGLVLNGWAYTGFTNTASDVTPVNVAVLAQNTDGTLRIANSEFFPDSITNGSGSVLATDFNGDGKDDIFLAAHNESPFKLKQSTAYLSKPDGTFNKVLLNDAVMAHHATIGNINGKPSVVITSFSEGASQRGSAIYSYDGIGNFVTNPNAHIQSFLLSAMSVTTGDFLGKGYEQFIYGDLTFGVGLPWSPTNTFSSYLYDFDGSNLIGPPVAMPPPYFNGKPAYSAIPSNWDPVSKSHEPRLWTDDLNQDGKPDIVVGTAIWPGWKSQLQLLINQGSGAFIDQTDAWGSPWNENSGLDYSLRMVDIDGSGIKTYFAAFPPSFCPNNPNCFTAANHGNYIIVNDGTGQLHLAMHNEFVNMDMLVSNWLRTKLPSSYLVGGFSKFIPYRTPSGLINFMCMVSVTKISGTNPKFYLVNVPLAINLNTLFRKNITVTNRHGSKNIRTFAGNDIIHGGNNGGTAKVDGGLGINTIVYAGNQAAYTVTKTATGYTVTHIAGTDGTDNIVNIQKLQFADGLMTLN